jgi:predicted chitinase
MYRKLELNESEVKHIKKLYGLKEEEQTKGNSFLNNIIQQVMSGASNRPPEDITDYSTPQSSSETPISGSGNVNIKGNFNSEQINNIKIVIDEMNKMGIKDPLTQVGILSVINKESNFKAFKEIGYGNTSDNRIISIFGDRGRRCKHLKNSNPEFFDCVYGYKSGAKLGNDQPGDGWKYIGRGFNGLTGKYNYKKYGDMVGLDLVSNPNLMEDPRVAAKVAIKFFTKGKSPNSFPKFKNKKEAAIYFADINAGGRKSEFARGPAVSSSEKFDI